MSRTLDDILRRRVRLQLASAALRGQVAAHAADLSRPLSWVDRAQAGLRQALARPGISALAAVAGLGLAYALGPRRTLAWGVKGLAAWRLWRNLRGGGA
jgi:hypothetical protein